MKKLDEQAALKIDEDPDLKRLDNLVKKLQKKGILPSNLAELPRWVGELRAGLRETSALVRKTETFTTRAENVTKRWENSVPVSYAIVSLAIFGGIAFLYVLAGITGGGELFVRSIDSMGKVISDSIRALRCGQ